MVLLSKPLLLVARPPSPPTTRGIAPEERVGLRSRAMLGGRHLQEHLITVISMPAALRQFTA